MTGPVGGEGDEEENEGGGFGEGWVHHDGDDDYDGGDDGDGDCLGVREW